MEPFQLGLFYQHLFEAMAITAEIEGMKAENSWRESRGESQAYPESAFTEKAQQLWGISNSVREIAR